MRTARSLPYLGSTWQRPPWTETPWTETPSPEQRPPWTETPPWTESQTGVKNYLPATSFVDGKKTSAQTWAHWFQYHSATVMSPAARNVGTVCLGECRFLVYFRYSENKFKAICIVTAIFTVRRQPPTPLGRHPLDKHLWADTPGETPPFRHPPAQCMLGYTHIHPAQCMLGYTPPSACCDTPPLPEAIAADGTHPTGMLSCKLIYFFILWWQTWLHTLWLHVQTALHSRVHKMENIWCIMFGMTEFYRLALFHIYCQ